MKELSDAVDACQIHESESEIKEVLTLFKYVHRFILGKVRC